MVATESNIMTNVIATINTLNPAGEKHARVRLDICRIATVAAEVVNHIYRLTKLKATDRVVSIQWLADGNDAGLGDVDIGIYTPSSTLTDPAVIDIDGLVDGDNLATGLSVPTEILGGGTNAGVEADFGKALWEYCPGGPATKPAAGTEYEICAQEVTGNPGGGVNFVFLIYYTHGD